MKSYEECLRFISNCIAEYKENEDKSARELVLKWASQFSAPSFMIKETAFIMNNFYITKKKEERLIKDHILSTEVLACVGDLTDCSILSVQDKDKSQSCLAKKLQNSFRINYNGIEIPINDETKKVFIYLDDCLFSGGTLIKDCNHSLLKNCKNKVIFLYFGAYTQGYKRVIERNEIIKKLMELDSQFFANYVFENEKKYLNNDDIFYPKRPTTGNLRHHVLNIDDYYFREPSSSSVGHVNISLTETIPIFSSSENRDKYENELVEAGVKIRRAYGIESESMNPLGLSPIDKLGFGGVLMNYRNCPNNLPLCFWYGDQLNCDSKWVPLMKRNNHEN